MKIKITFYLSIVLLILIITGCSESATETTPEPDGLTDNFLKLELTQQADIDEGEFTLLESYELLNNNIVDSQNLCSKEIEFDENRVSFSIEGLEDDVVIILTFMPEGGYINRRLTLQNALPALLSYDNPVKGRLQAFILNPTSQMSDTYQINITSYTSSDSILLYTSQHSVTMEPTLVIDKSDLDLVAQHNFTFDYENFYDSTLCVLSKVRSYERENLNWNYTRIRGDSWTKHSLIGGDFREFITFYSYLIIEEIE